MKRVRTRPSKKGAYSSMAMGAILLVLGVVFTLQEPDMFSVFLIVMGVALAVVGAINAFGKKSATMLDVVVDDDWQEGMPIPKIKEVRAVEELKRQYNRGQLSKEYFEKRKKEILKR